MMEIQDCVIFLFVLVGGLFLMPQKTQDIKAFKFLVFVLLILVVTFRPSTMADYEQYKEAFISSGASRLEPTFYLIRAFTVSINSYLLGFFIYALISIWIKYVCISEYKNLFWASTLVYISNILIVQDMVAIRAGVAGSCVLMAIHYKLKDNRTNLFLFVLIAIMFHYTAIVFFLLFIMSSIKPRKMLYVGLVIVSYFLAIRSFYLTQLFSYIPFVGNYFALFDNYVSEMDSQITPMNIFNLLQVGHILICITFWFLIDKIKERYNVALLLLKLYTIGICCVCWFAQSFVIAIRFSELFFVTEILLIPMGFSAIFTKKHLYRIVLVIYSIVIFYIRMSDLMYWNPNKL